MDLKVFAVFVLLGLVQEVPYKPSNEFEAAVDLQFKSRPAADGSTYDANGNKFEKNTGMLPFFSVNLLHISTAKGESRFKALDSNRKNIAARKMAPNTSYRFDLGFIDDLKKGVVATNLVTVYFLNDKKVEISKVVLEVTKDGDFFVNGEKRGQF